MNISPVLQVFQHSMPCMSKSLMIKVSSVKMILGWLGKCASVISIVNSVKPLSINLQYFRGSRVSFVSLDHTVEQSCWIQT